MTWGDPKQDTSPRERMTPDGEVVAAMPDLEIMSEEEIGRLIDAIVHVTKRDPKLWMLIDQGADPYLTADGCKLVATAFHIDTTAIRFDKDDVGEDDENGDPLVSYSCTITGSRPLPGGHRRTLTAIGECSTGLKAIVAQRKRKGDKDPSMTRGDQCSRAREMARARAFNQLITGILGIPAITWDDLHSRGIGMDQVKTTGRGGAPSGGGSGGGGYPSKADKDFLWSALKGDGDYTKDDLSAATTAVCGHFKKIADLTGDEARAIVARMKGGGQGPAQGSGDPNAPADEAQGREFYGLCNELGEDPDAVLATHGHKGGGPPSAAVATAAIKALRAAKAGGAAQSDIPF